MFKIGDIVQYKNVKDNNPGWIAAKYKFKVIGDPKQSYYWLESLQDIEPYYDGSWNSLKYLKKQLLSLNESSVELVNKKINHLPKWF
jgi:hypothetical protein